MVNIRSTNFKEVADAKCPVGIGKYKEGTKIMFFFLWFVLLIFGILAFIVKIPIRLVADVKNIMRDFLEKYEQ